MIYILPTDTCFGIACPIDDTKSYDEIYKIKKRDYSKPLAIMVKDFSFLEKNTDLNINQINFLKDYKKPFTILSDSKVIKMILNLEQDDFNYENKEIYKKIAFRVANSEIQKKLINEIGPFFLTSANLSGKKEIYDLKEAINQFGKYKNIVFLGNGYKLNEEIKPSDIFEFIGDTTEIKYSRQK